GSTMIGGVFPAIVLVLIVSGAFAGFVYYSTKPEQVPRFHTALAYMGFGVSVVWIYCIATEIVVLLQAVGTAFNLSESILGLTILAWGNCLLDFLSNLAVARKGFPRMGIAACFGAPFLTLLLGVGVPCIIELIGDGGAGMVSSYVSNIMLFEEILRSSSKNFVHGALRDVGKYLELSKFLNCSFAYSTYLTKCVVSERKINNFHTPLLSSA
ncbi:hypothetical protein NPIL_106431, partial [Nephila pilipes]